MWWKILLFFWIAAFTAIGIVTPIAGGIGDLNMMAAAYPEKILQVILFPGTDGTLAEADEGGGWLVTVTDAAKNTAVARFASQDVLPAGETGVLVKARYDHEHNRIDVMHIVGGDPLLSFPFIPGLEERAKIIFFHVPMSWLTVIAFIVSMWYGIKYLRYKDLEDDFRSSLSAGLGLLFCILATTTGSLWAKFNWGSFWNWDPRETSIFVLLLVYGAYFALRSAVEVEEKRASLSAVYAIVAAASVPFFIFIMPRIMPGLHPGSADDVNAGPVVSSGGMDATMRVVLYSMLAGYLLLYVWLMRIRMRLHRISLKRAAAAA